MEMFWKLLWTCLGLVIIWKLREPLVGVIVCKLGEWLVGVIVFKLVERLVEKWVVEPIVCKIESIVWKARNLFVTAILRSIRCKARELFFVEERVDKKIVCKVAEWLVIKICLVGIIVYKVVERLVEEIVDELFWEDIDDVIDWEELDYVVKVRQQSVKEIGYGLDGDDNNCRLKVVVDELRAKVRDIENKASYCVQVREWRKSAFSALREASKFLKDPEVEMKWQAIASSLEYFNI